MRSQNQQQTTRHPEGRVDIPGLLYGSVGLVLSFALMGVFKRADTWLFDRLHQPLFDGGSPQLPSTALSLFCSAVFCYGIAFAVLDSPGLWRRVVLGITAVVLCLAMVPAFAVWNVYFPPFVQIVGVFWSWFCVVIYTQHHQMPCDAVHVDIQMAPSESLLMQPIDQPVAQPVLIDHVHEQTELAKRGEDKYKPQADIGEKKVPEQKGTAGSKKSGKKSAKRKRPHKRSKRK